MSDRDWLVPSVVVTLVSGAIAFLLIPDYSGILPAILLVPMWMLVSMLFGVVYAFFKMAVARVESPIAHARNYITRDWRKLAFFIGCVFLAAVNMTTFMWTKPLLNSLIPFWADPMLADVDRALFLGHDPWVLLTWLNSSPMAIFYHRGWFAMMIVTLLAVLMAPPSPKKSAVMMTYFILWSVAGPLIHILLPAAGPIFYAQMGYGSRFAGLENVSETREVATYLWTLYSHEGFGPGSGISAMPSLHIATSAWMLIAVRNFARWLMGPMVAATFLIFLLSIALGWHYAVDGIVGAAVALICYAGLRVLYSRKSGWNRPAVLAG